jgi:uncharacterized membrane protein YagU involved in acid resistance
MCSKLILPVVVLEPIACNCNAIAARPPEGSSLRGPALRIREQPAEEVRKGTKGVTTAHRSALNAIVVAGLISGSVDIGAAAVINWLSPVVILHAIASGLIGKASFTGGGGTALLGLLLQWAMSILIAAIYLVVTAPLAGMRRRWTLTGLIAGIVIFFAMNYLVVPLSAAPFRPEFNLYALLTHFTPFKFAANLLAMLLFGLIIAFCARATGRPQGRG